MSTQKLSRFSSPVHRGIEAAIAGLPSRMVDCSYETLAERRRVVLRWAMEEGVAAIADYMERDEDKSPCVLRLDYRLTLERGLPRASVYRSRAMELDEFLASIGDEETA